MHTKAVQIFLTFLHPSGPSRSYKYPDVPVIITLPLTEILISLRVVHIVEQDVLYPHSEETKATADNLRLEHVEFFVSIACLFCQCVLYYVC